MRLFRIAGIAAVGAVLLGGVILAANGAKDPEVQPTPMMRAVHPETVRAGEIAVVTGDYLDKSRVAGVFLTNGQKDTKVEILEQTASSIKFRVPEKMAAGRYNLVVLLTDAEPKLIDEPARLTVE
jgi:hypothetical protein